MRWLPLLFLVSCAAPASPLAGADAPPPFDSTRYMHVAEVKEGMTGYGLSVFQGTRIERFEVKVISVLHNFNPKYDVILIACQGPYLEHTGIIAGMSGSPVYLKDDLGRYRMIGAVAYGWGLSKDPVGGVQPIEYMLQLPDNPVPPATAPARSSQTPAHADAAGAPMARWSLEDVARPGPSLKHTPNALAAQNRLGGDDAAPHLEPLATPLMTAGISQNLLEQFRSDLGDYGLVALQAGTGGGATTAPATQPARLEPGSVLAVPLLTGDADMTAIGTCTEVDGDRVYGFGHCFDAARAIGGEGQGPGNGEGPVSLPMGAGQIDGVIANLSSSFKLGALTKISGTLLADQTVGIAGRLGAGPAMAAMDLKVVYADASRQATTYHFNIAQHPKITPIIATMAVGAALTGVRDLPLYHTLDYDLQLEFANAEHLHLANSSVNVNVLDLFNEIGLPIAAADDNPFDRVPLSRLSGTITLTPMARQATILSVSVPRLKYRPGETAKIFVNYRPFRAAEAVMSVDFELPRDLPNGIYQLWISDAQTYLQLEEQSRPFRFTAQSIQELFAVLHDVTSIRHDALYVQLHQQADGVAIGHTAMPHLPSSRRQVLLGAGLSDTTPFISSTLKVVPTSMVMSGMATFNLTIDREAKVDAAAKTPVKKTESHPELHGE
jgi:hypothetical protein